MNLESIIPLARKYAAAREKVGNILSHIKRAQDRILAENMPELRKAVSSANVLRDGLTLVIQENPEVFTKPKTQTVDGIKFGLAMSKARIAFDDPDRILAAIRKKLPQLSDALIHTKQEPNKEALAKLTDDQLAALGVTRIAAKDEVTIKDTASDIDKLVKALLEKESAPQLELVA